MRVQLVTDWTDGEKVLHKAGTIVDIDPSHARRLYNTGVACVVVVPPGKSTGATANKMVEKDDKKTEEKTEEKSSEDLHPGLKHLQKKAKKK